jgi:hypothetical protein
MVLGTFMRISGLWLPIDDSGWGLFMTFVNGNFRDGSDRAYSATDHPQPAGYSLPTVVGQFSEAESMPITMFINTADNKSSGVGWAYYIDWVRVYTTGSNTPKFRHSKIGARGGSRQMAQ